MSFAGDFRWHAAIARARRPLNVMMRARIVSALCTPHVVDSYIALFDAAWSVRTVRARVVRIDSEADRATSLWLQPNENWEGFRAGQYVAVTADVAGVRRTRCFSISSAPEDGPAFRITIKAFPDGRVGGWAAKTANPGDIVGLSQALGDFVLPRALPRKLLFVGGGSGITPLASMVRHLLATEYRGDIVCLHYAHRESLLGEELTALSCRHPNFRFVPVLTGRRVSTFPNLEGRFSRAHLDAAAAAWSEHEVFVCGPPPLESAVTELIRQHGLESRLHLEHFVRTAHEQPAGRSPLAYRVTFAKSSRHIQGNSRDSLLAQAEALGLRPMHGCRMGICHRCKCKKLSGVVRNRITGSSSADAEEEIQLCVSTPESDVVLEL